MNAVLQALAHAPELCLAMDVAPHHVDCAIWLENKQRNNSRSPSSSPDHSTQVTPTTGVRKSRRQSRSPTAEDETKFCVLCEMEQHIHRVHTAAPEKPVAPTNFVNGFIHQVAPWFKLGQQEDSHEFLRLLIDAMQRSCGESPHKEEYPFQLFRGMIESNVTCESCGSTSSTKDPIEDIGLDVSSSTPGQLTDVSAALGRFARAEALDSGYKCEKCGKVGRATKESRLASIPPILTLHLKRFRYGEAAPASATTQRRSRSEVSQLLNHDRAGKSGSAKVEGHSKFEQILDLKPYMTDHLQKNDGKMLCRLFAVVVHAGKNSHSGHYIAYVRNVTKNEWWKMDDARVTIASHSEVMNAEAYMLFYRVVEHPFAIKLREKERELLGELDQPTESLAVLPTVTDKKNNFLETPLVPPVPTPSQDMASIANSSMALSSVPTNASRKRKAPEFTSGEVWARACTTLDDQDDIVAQFRDVENCISEQVTFKPDFFSFLKDQATRRNAKVGHGPSSGICGTS
jgi:ubiquitin C-terminal hydrolase